MKAIPLDIAQRAAQRLCTDASVDLVLPGDPRRELVVLAMALVHSIRGTGWTREHIAENVSVTVPGLGVLAQLGAGVAPAVGERAGEAAGEEHLAAREERGRVVAEAPQRRHGGGGEGAARRVVDLGAPPGDDVALGVVVATGERDEIAASPASPASCAAAPGASPAWASPAASPACAIGSTMCSVVEPSGANTAKRSPAA